MSFLGSWKIDDLLTFYANTTRFDTGVATDADAVPAYRVYEDESGTAILTGNMALLDSANTAGFYSEQITLSAANGFEKGKSYAIYIAATVNAVAGATHHTLQIEAEVDANRINWANIDNSTTAQNLSATNIDVDQVVGSVTGAVGSVTGAVGSVTAMVTANATQISGDSTAADNLEADYDGTQHNATRNASAKFLADIIESQRGHHTYSGNIFYVDGFGGDDTTGNGSRALPYKTISKALTVCTSGNHDIVECISNPGATPTIISEAATITVSKAYTFIRGPGRGVQVDLTGTGYVFDITAAGVEISGFDIVGNGAGTSGGVKLSTADFAFLYKLWIASPTQDGIQLTVSNNTSIQDCTIVGAGRDNIRIDSGAGAGQYTRILNCILRDAVGSAVNLAGTDASECQIRFCIIRDNAVGITIGVGVTDTVVTDNRFVNNTATITDGGTRTLQEFNFLSTNTAGTVARVTLVDTLATNNDKTGYALSTAGVQAIWDALTAALTTVGSIGKLLVDNVNATISSRSSHSAADVWAVAARLLTAGTNIVLAKGVGVTGFNDPTTAAIADANWDELRSGHSTQGSYGESFFSIESAAAAAGTLSTTEMTTDLTEATDDHYIGRIIIWTSGVLLRQATDITDYVGLTKKLVFTAVTEAPTAGDKFIIV
jgi:hypothetical protein